MENPDAQLLSYARVGATNSEIADALGCTQEHLIAQHKEVLARIRAEFRIRLRAKQLQLAMEGDRPMLLWFAKEMHATPGRLAAEPATADPSIRKDETIDQVFDRS